jgi:hypothetical protein
VSEIGHGGPFFFFLKGGIAVLDLCFSFSPENFSYAKKKKKIFNFVLGELEKKKL